MFLSFLIRPIAYISLPVVLLKSVAASSSTGRYYVRLVMYLGALTFVSSCGAAVALVMSVAGRKYDVNFIMARFFYIVASRVMDITVEVDGIEYIESAAPTVLMVNHQSVVDLLIVGKLIPKRSSIMSKNSIRFTPMGPFMLMSGAIFVDRGNNARAVRSMKAAGERMRDKRVSLWMFPEGTRNLTEECDMLPFKKGGFHLALQADIPILPIVVENYHWLYHKGVFGTGVIKVKVLPPVSTVGLQTEDCNDLVQNVRNQMIQTLREMSRSAPPVKTVEEPPADQKPAVVEDIPEVTSRSRQPSENGTESEDDGMVLVGRPTAT